MPGGLNKGSSEPFLPKNVNIEKIFDTAGRRRVLLTVDRRPSLVYDTERPYVYVYN